MNLSRLFVMACAALAVISCTKEVPVPPERMFQKGYSLVPLNEKGWGIVERNQFRLSMGKRGKNPGETFAIQARVDRMPLCKDSQEFSRIVKASMVQGIDLRRFTLVEHDVYAYRDRETDCAKTHMVTEDHEAGKKAGRKGVMVLEVLALTCAHPKNKSVGITVSFSQRYFPGQRESNFDEKAAAVLDSVEFADF